MVHKVDQVKSTFGLGFQRAKDMQNPVAVIAGRFTVTLSQFAFAPDIRKA
jgi:hypothetical protein